MNISYNWLKEYVNFDLTPDEVAEALTSIGLETGGVEEVQTIKGGLEVGQEVITAGGIYGKIKEIEDNTVVLEIASGVKIKIDRNSIFANAASNQQQAK